MKLQTLRFGELDLQETEIIHFEQGLPGFEDSRRFTLVEVEDHAPFAHLQSADNGELAFVVVDPFEFFPDYEFDLPESALEGLKITAPEQIMIRVIVSIRDNLESATANLVAPVAFNMEKRLGRQVVLAKTGYMTKHALFMSDALK